MIYEIIRRLRKRGLFPEPVSYVCATAIQRPNVVIVFKRLRFSWSRINCYLKVIGQSLKR